MNAHIERPITFLVIATALGAAAQVLFHPGMLGINVPLFLLALAVGVAFLARLSSIPITGDGRWLLLPALFFAAAVAWRASPVLQTLNTVSVLAILAIAAFRLRGGTIRFGFVSEVLWQGGLALVALTSGGWHAVRSANVDRLRDATQLRTAVSLLRGAAIGIPLLLVFGVLFALADDVFLELVRGSVTVDVSFVARHVFGWLVWSWLSAGVLAALFGVQEQDAPKLAPAPWARLGPVEVGTALGLLDLLFLAFVAVQVHYLFGGAGHVEATAGLTYAEYARRGFFELLAVAALVLPVVLGIHWLLRDASPGARVAFRVLSVALIVLLFVVIASALERMRAYVGEFGLTQLRLYSTVAMLWLAVVFAWLLATVIRERRQRFAGGAFAAGLLAVAGLNVLNPDAFIIRTNLERADDGRFDAAYAASLSPDATPTIVARLAAVEDPAARCDLAVSVVSEYPADQPWQAWNLSRDRADEALRQGAVALEDACKP